VEWCRNVFVLVRWQGQVDSAGEWARKGQKDKGSGLKGPKGLRAKRAKDQEQKGPKGTKESRAKRAKKPEMPKGPIVKKG